MAQHRGLKKVRQACREAGYVPYAVDYPSIFTKQMDHAQQLQHLLAQAPTTEQRFVVSHSMGGLVLRQLSTIEPHAFSAAVMLFPPHQGAHKANAWHQKWWYRASMGPAGQELTTAAVKDLPTPRYPCHIIAGGNGKKGRSFVIPGDDDGTVGVAETHLAGQASHHVLPVDHTFGMNDRELIELTINTLAQYHPQ